MYQELSQEYQKSIHEEQYDSVHFDEIDNHLKQKAFELQRLQLCFEAQIKEIQNYEKKQKMYKRVVNMILMSFKYFKNQLKTIHQLWDQIIIWKQEIVQNLKVIPLLASKTFNKSSQRQQQMVKSRFQVNQNQFKLIQLKYQEQIQKQARTIKQLEKQLKKKSLSKNKLSQPNIKRQNSSIYLKSQESHMSSVQKNSQNKQLKQTNKYSNLKDRSISKTKQCQKNISKEEVVEKIRQYHKSKAIRQNVSNIQKKISECEIKRPSFQIPTLPQLRINYNFFSPITNGFEVLVMDGKQVYKGMWKKGFFQGRGKYYSDNWVYDGQFKGGNIEGFGTLNFKGCTFIGKFQSGQAQGQGTLYCKQKPIPGLWKDNILVKQY